MSRLPVDHSQIEQFVKAIFPYASAGQTISIRTFPEVKAGAPTICPVKINGTGLAPVIEEAIRQAQWAADHPKPRVFCPPLAGFNGGRAREQDLTEAYALSVECDQAPTEARQRLEALLGPATVVVASGGVCIDPST